MAKTDETKTIEVKKKRIVGLELLRILAMFLICCVHLMNAGGMRDNSGGGFALYSQNLLYAFFLISVNVFVLITGYFMVKSKIKPKKILFLWFEVAFYSVVTYLVTSLFFENNFSFKEFVICFLPILYNKYWFFTAYFLLYISIPILNKIFVNLEKNTAYKIVVFVFILSYVYTHFKANQVVSLNYGYSYLWFIILYSLGACLRLYPPRLKKIFVFIVYMVCTLLVFGFTFVPENLMNALFIKYLYNDLNYTTPLVLLASLSAVYLFKDLDLDNKVVTKMVCYLSSCTFGIYLYHCSDFFSTLVFKILKIDRFYGSNYSVMYVLWFALVIFILGVVIDSLRKLCVFCIKNVQLKILNYRQLNNKSNKDEDVTDK